MRLREPPVPASAPKRPAAVHPGSGARASGQSRGAQIAGRLAAIQLRKADANPARKSEPDPASRRNETGLPDRLKAGVEALSGISLDDVRVHYSSSKPTQLQALAYTQGTEIHVAPGQEKHLAHEAWHVVQQKQGRVQATRQLKGTSINDDPALEAEADMMGMRAATHAESRSGPPSPSERRADTQAAQPSGPIQRAGAVVQLRASQGLLDMKADRDRLYARVPNAFAERRAILADVPARANDLRRLDTAKAGADEIWDAWQTAHDRAEQDQPVAYPNRILNTDRAAMTRHCQAYLGVEELINARIRRTKGEVADKHYVKGNVPNLATALRQDDDEGLNALKTRLREVVTDYIQPGKSIWFGGIGYANGDPQFRQLTALKNTSVQPHVSYNIHWTVYYADMGDLAALKTNDDLAGDIVPALIPNGGTKDGVHVTLERYGANSTHNPRAYGRPASRATRVYNLPGNITSDDLHGRLDAENTRRKDKVEAWADARNEKVVPGWENH